MELSGKYPLIVKEYNDSSYRKPTGDFDTDYMLIDRLYGEIRYLATYEAYLKQVDDQAQNIATFSVFNRSRSFANNNILRTAEDFDRLHGVSLRLDNYEAVNEFVSFSATDVFAIGLLLLLGILLVAAEQDKDLFRLLKTTRYGRAQVICANLIYLAGASAVLALALYGTDYLLAVRLYGAGDLSAPVQSIPLFRQCTALISVKEFLLITFALKAAVLFCIGALFLLLLLLTKNATVSCAIAAIALAASYGAYRLLAVNSYVNYFKFVNLFAFLDAPALFTQYQNLNFFHFPVNIRGSMAVALPLLGVAAIAACVVGYLRNTRLALPPLERGLDLLGRALDRLRWHGSLFLFEMHKSLFPQKGILVLLALIAVATYSIATSLVVNDQETKIYQSYIRQWGGALTEETLAKAEAEQRFFDSIDAQLADLAGQLERGEINQPQYNGATAKLTYYREKYSAFITVRQQIEELRQTKRETGRVVWLIDTTGYQRLFAANSFDEDIHHMLMAVVVIILLVSPAFAYDNRKRIGPLFSSTKRGALPLLWTKAAVAAVLTFFVTVIVYGAQCWEIARWYGMPGLHAPVQSILAFRRLPMSVSILQFLLLSNALRFLALLFVALFVLLISKLSSGVALAAMLSAVALCSPIVMDVFGLRQSRYFSLIPALSANMLFLDRGPSDRPWLLWYPGILLASVLLFACLFALLRARPFASGRRTVLPTADAPQR